MILALEAAMHSKTEEASVSEEKRAKMEEILWNAMKQNCEHAKTNSELSGAYNILKVDNERVQSKIQKLRARFWA